MTFLLILPTILSFLLLAAHFLHARYSFIPEQFLLVGGVAFAVASVIVPGILLAIQRRWALRLVQVLLAFAAAEWIVAGLEIVNERQAAGAPWTAAAIIMGSVAGFTLLSAACLQHRRVRAAYPTQAGGA